MGFDLNAYQKLMDQQDWTTLRNLMLRDGPSPNGWKIKDPGLKEEHVSEAIAKVYTGDQAWDATKGALITKLRQVLWSVISNEQTRMENAARAFDVLDEDGNMVNPVDLVVNSNPAQDVELETRLEWEAVLKANENDEEAMIVLMAVEDGCRGPQELSEETGYPIKTVRNVLKRIRRKR